MNTTQISNEYMVNAIFLDSTNKKFDYMFFEEGHLYFIDDMLFFKCSTGHLRTSKLLDYEVIDDRSYYKTINSVYIFKILD